MSWKHLYMILVLVTHLRPVFFYGCRHSLKEGSTHVGDISVSSKGDNFVKATSEGL